MEALNASGAAKATNEFIDEMRLHTEQCKPAVAWRAINRLTGRKFMPLYCLSAASITDRKQQLTNHYSAILKYQLNQQQQQYRLFFFQQWQQRNSNQESTPFTTTAIRATNEFIDEMRLHTEKCKPAVAWRAINRLTGRKFMPFYCLSAASITDRKQQLTNHYSAILKCQHNQQQQQYRLFFSQQWQQRNSNQESAPFTTTAIRAALRTSRNDTSPGHGDIPNRVLKIPELDREVTDMLNRHSKALNIENTVLDDWMKSVIVSIPKKGNSTAFDNQRGIAKTYLSAKLFNEVLLSRLKPKIYTQLSQCQSGLRAGSSTLNR